MSDTNDTFFTAIGCMDGRVQDPIAKFGREKFGARYADTITEAGLVGQVANGTNSALVEAIKKKLLISIEKHHSKGVTVHGHQECAGNPVDDEKHREDVRKAAEFVRNLAPNTEVIPVFVVKENGEWKVEPL